MNELVKVQTTEYGEQRVSARELHRNLESKKKFFNWWETWGKNLMKTMIILPVTLRLPPINTAQLS